MSENRSAITDEFVLYSFKSNIRDQAFEVAYNRYTWEMGMCAGEHFKVGQGWQTIFRNLQGAVTSTHFTVSITVTATLLTVTSNSHCGTFDCSNYSQCDTFDYGKLQSLQHF